MQRPEPAQALRTATGLVYPPDAPLAAEHAVVYGKPLTHTLNISCAFESKIRHCAPPLRCPETRCGFLPPLAAPPAALLAVGNPPLQPGPLPQLPSPEPHVEAAYRR